MPSGLIRFAVAGFLAIAAAFGLAHAGALPSRRRPRPPPAPPATPAPAAQAPAPAAKPAEAPSADQSCARRPCGCAKPATPATPSGEGSIGETVDLPARPFAYIEGKADRDEIYGAILGSLSLVKREMDKAGFKPAGRPLAVFVESDDTGFQYHAGYPIEAAPEGKRASPTR